MTETNERPNVRVFDEGSLWQDRYTVVWSDLTFISMSESGKVYEGNDFGTHHAFEGWLKTFNPVEISFAALPPACQEKVIRDSEEACE